MSIITTTPVVKYNAVDRVKPALAGFPRQRFPLPQDCPIQLDAYAVDQDCEMLVSNFPPAVKNTPSNAVITTTPTFAGLFDSNAILTRYTQPQNTMGGLCKFTASFARVPASWDEFVSQSVTFPGLDDFPYAYYTVSRGRQPRTKLVTVRMRYDYFVIDPNAILSGAGVLDSGGSAITTVASKGSIPTIYKNEWVVGKLVGGTWTPIPNIIATSLVPIGGFTAAGLFHIPTIPSLDHYLTFISNAIGVTLPWTQTNPPVFSGSDSDTASGQFCVEDSKLIDYEGNICARVTPYALFQ